MPPLIKFIKATKESIFNFDHLRFAVSQPPERFCPETFNIKRNTCPQSVSCLVSWQAKMLACFLERTGCSFTSSKKSKARFLFEWVKNHDTSFLHVLAHSIAELIIFQTNYRLSWWICMCDHLSQVCQVWVICNHRTNLFTYPQGEYDQVISILVVFARTPPYFSTL